MIANRLTAAVATAAGYHGGMEEKERERRFKEAGEVIAGVKSGSRPEIGSQSGLILATLPAIDGFDAMVKGFEKAMEKLAKQLPVATWLALPAQRGFGLLSLAKVVGECGDLSNYAAPGKLWKRMGCAPFESQGRNLMPSTWRNTKPGLSADEWTEIGYSPRRRSIAYLIGEGLVKQNFVSGGTGEMEPETDGLCAGPYRSRYDQTKAKLAAAHPDYKPLRCHLHGMLLATKLLLKNLWIEWTNGGDPIVVTEGIDAAVASETSEDEGEPIIETEDSGALVLA
jgi:hypothetical protein